MNLRHAIATSLALTLAFASAAHASSATFAGYTVAYESSLWAGAAVSQTGNTLTFSGLGLDAFVKSRPGTTGHAEWGGEGNLYISLNPGYKIDSVFFNVKGSYEIAGLAGTAMVSTNVDYGPASETWPGNWSGGGAGASFSSGTGSYDKDGSAYLTCCVFDSTTPVVLRYRTEGLVNVRDFSSAKITQDSASFTFHVVAVPEPGTYAMFLAGLGLMGVIARRKRQTA